MLLLDRRDVPPAGAGETPIVCVAPAIANAVHAATVSDCDRFPSPPPGRRYNRCPAGRERPDPEVEGNGSNPRAIDASTVHRIAIPARTGMYLDPMPLSSARSCHPPPRRRTRPPQPAGSSPQPLPAIAATSSSDLGTLPIGSVGIISLADEAVLFFETDDLEALTEQARNSESGTAWRELMTGNAAAEHVNSSMRLRSS